MMIHILPQHFHFHFHFHHLISIKTNNEMYGNQSKVIIKRTSKPSCSAISNTRFPRIRRKAREDMISGVVLKNEH